MGKHPTSTSTSHGTSKAKRTRRSSPRGSPMQRSSIYRGVTRHRWTGRFEVHLWDKSCWNESQKKKGKQVYLGAYDDEAAAARAYDLAAIKYWGKETTINFPLRNYGNEMEEMEGQSREEYIGSLRRKSSGFSRGVSKYRGVARHHQNGRWEARIGRVLGNKYLYLGTFATQEEAAMAYDMAAIEYRSQAAVTNFNPSHYLKWIRPDRSSTIVSRTQVEEDADTSSFIASSTGTKPATTPDCIDDATKQRQTSRRSFPDDIQTQFDYVDDIIFGDLEAISSTIFEFELNTTI